ncbi:MAG: beta-ketoacyl synthase chain length factor [Methylobacillus sp.]|nr:beta-ketoacyl synthase chain length factor [Methylobacillus sp.]
MKQLHFSVRKHAVWPLVLALEESWHEGVPAFAENVVEPALRVMPAMLRRRTNFTGKMALEVAFECLGQLQNVPVVFCSRHGEVERSVSMLTDKAQGEPVSPMAFSLSVHNAVAGLFSIARSDHAPAMAIAAQQDVVENAVIEACSLLNDGATSVLLVVYDNRLPLIYRGFEDEAARPFAWAWLMEKPQYDVLSLSWQDAKKHDFPCIQKSATLRPLDILRFYLQGEKCLSYTSDRRAWCWERYAQ